MQPSDKAHQGLMTRKLNRDWAMGKAAYEAYVQATDDGEAFPWEGLASRVQRAWFAAAWAAWQEHEEI